MKHTYNITGMTCVNCEQKITKALLSIRDISEVKIDREIGTVVISMSAQVQISVMQDLLNGIGDYQIRMNTEISMRSMEKRKKHLKDLLPLFVIAGVILLFSVIMTLFNNQDLAFGMRMFMGAFFMVFGILKTLKLKDFVITYKKYDIIAKRSNIYAHAYPFIELGLGALYFTNVAPLLTNVLTVVVMGIGAIGVYIKLRKKEEIPCACLGTVFKVPMTWVTLVEDLLMLIMAIIMILLM